ncbi:MarR family winged helix-turn-helix transcriptional regulator [Nonomuraea dietziae]|uniref:MarR family winged helix-turn-helix transcriptional regulator n=1 Tax=Nonomuraea dietziae TaxID=65515 RepID=UPI0031E40831
MADAVAAVLEQWRRERPDIDVRPIGVVGRIMRISRMWDKEIKDFLAGHGLEPGEFDVLSTLRRSGEPYELTAGTFLKTSLVTTGAITLRVDRMEDKGLVTRVRDTADRRSVKIRLTDLGLEGDRQGPASARGQRGPSPRGPRTGGARAPGRHAGRPAGVVRRHTASEVIQAACLPGVERVWRRRAAPRRRGPWTGRGQRDADSGEEGRLYS